jgi:PAS domain S-box-containing protein
MPDIGGPRFVIDRSLDEVVRVLNGAAIIVHDFDGVVSRCTCGCERLYGWTRDEAVGQIVHDLLATVFPQSLDSIRERVRASGAWHGELTHRHKDGHRIYVASRWTSPEQQGCFGSAIVETNNDISDLRTAQQGLLEREALLRSILDTAPESVIVINEHGAITSLSTTAEQLFGYEPGELDGQDVTILMPSQERQAHPGYIARYLATGERRIIGSRRIVTGQRKDGSTFPMELSVGASLANGHHVFTGFVRDLTSRQKMEADLRQAQKMEAVGQLTGGLAHDFNNLLTIIMGNLEMLQPRLADEGQRLLLEEARGAAIDGAKLTGQLLAFGRRQPLNARLVDIGQLVSGFADLLRRAVNESVELRTIVTGSANLARVDASQLQNALLNLALNARDAMQDGGRLTIEISRTRLDVDEAQIGMEMRPDEYILIAITDTGEGMSAEVQQRAFEPFFTTKGLGSGLGLTMVYGFVKQSKGHVEIHSDIGKGTSIRLFLPAVAVEAQSLQQDALAADTSVREPSPDGETILVVEDEPRVRRVAAARLTEAGYTVVEAANGAEALAQLATNPEIKLAFTDIVMPGGMNGEALARKIRAQYPDVKILFTSGYAESAASGNEPTLAGNLLHKPYSPHELITTIGELLHR